MSGGTRGRPFDVTRALVGTAAIVAILVIGALWQRLHPYSIETSADIDAPPAEVWAALTDLDAYPDWNPTIVKASGSIAVGATLHLREGTVDKTATVSRVKANSSLGWNESETIVGIFDGERLFTLEPLAGGGTRFTQTELFRGILVPFQTVALHDDTAPSMHAMNAALRDLVEKP